MSASWQSALEQLRGFIASNPRIEFSQTSTSLPGDVRPEFYRLFDSVRAAFIKDNFSSELAKSLELNRQWHELKKDVTAKMGLEDVEVSSDLSRYLADPLDGLTRLVFDPLFDLLKGRIDEPGFRSASAQVVTRDYTALFHEGYKRWASLAIIKLLDADELFSVAAKDYKQEAAIIENDPSQYAREEEVPDAEPAKRLVFEHSYMHSFLTPRIIVRSRAVGRMVALRADFYRARWVAKKVSEKQEWLNINDIEKEHGRADLWPELLIYTADDAADLALVSDYRRIARPDLCIDFREGDDWYSGEALESARRHARVLKPRLGSFVVSRAAVPEAAAAAGQQPAGITENPDPHDPQDTELPAGAGEPVNISVLSAGFNVKALMPVIESLKNAKAL